MRDSSPADEESSMITNRQCPRGIRTVGSVLQALEFHWRGTWALLLAPQNMRRVHLNAPWLYGVRKQNSNTLSNKGGCADIRTTSCLLTVDFAKFCDYSLFCVDQVTNLWIGFPFLHKYVRDKFLLKTLDRNCPYLRSILWINTQSKIINHFVLYSGVYSELDINTDNMGRCHLACIDESPCFLSLCLRWWWSLDYVSFGAASPSPSD